MAKAKQDEQLDDIIDALEDAEGASFRELTPEARRAINRGVAWLSLDEEDNAPVRFFTHLVAALRRVDAEVGLAEISNIRQLAHQGFFAQMGRVKMDVIINLVVAPDALAGPDFRQN